MISLLKTRRTFASPTWVVLVSSVFFLFTFVAGCGDNVLQPNAQNPNSKDIKAVEFTDFNGEDLYMGIFMAHGEVAERIPEIRDHLMLTNYINDGEQLVAIETMQNRIIDAVRSTDPEFFDAFKIAMNSGNHLTIQNKLKEASIVTVEAISGLPEIQDLRAEMEKNPALITEIMDEMNQRQKGGELDEATIQKALDISILQALDADGAEIHPHASIVAVIFAAAAVVAAVTIVAAQSYAVALNVAGAINVAAAVVAWVEVVTPEQELAKENSLLSERIIHSIATM